jgi:polyphosphate kinase
MNSLFLPTPVSLLASPKEPFIHRDASWIQFNQRVLEEARSSSNPLLERLKFLTITSRNLDEFFMVRYASILKKAGRLQGGDVFRESILDNVATFSGLQSETFDFLISELEPYGLQIVQQVKYDEKTFADARRVYIEKVYPHLGPPELVDQNSLSLAQNLQLCVMASGGLGWRIPKTIPQVFIDKTDSLTRVFFLDDLLLNFVNESFGLKGPVGVLRFTRDGDLQIEGLDEDPDSIPEKVRANLKSRDAGRIVRVQSVGEISDYWLNKLVKFGKINTNQIQASPLTLCVGSVWNVLSLLFEQFRDKPALMYPHQFPCIPDELNLKTTPIGDVFQKLQSKDVLLHHPYDSFEGFVNFIRAAAEDPLVEEIYQTVYRMDTVSPVVDILCSAASNKSNPKKVSVIIELRARFDELNNLELAERLRSSGVHVGFGFGKLKVHAKIALVVRKGSGTSGKVDYFTHLSTGNYNSQTAKVYEDFGIITSNQTLGIDAYNFFKSVVASEIPKSFKSLVGAPTQLHKKLLSLIETETAASLRGEKGRIMAKVNALVDHGVIAKLYEASKAGVKIDLIVRGACSLIPGVKGLSDNIRVISIVDRYLEHSRIYYFGHSRKLYLSSADWMPRNFFSRLELAFPIEDQELFGFIESVVLPAYMVDTVRARELTPQGTWKKRTTATLSTEQKKKLASLMDQVEGKNYESSRKQSGRQLRVQFFLQDLKDRMNSNK